MSVSRINNLLYSQAGTLYRRQLEAAAEERVIQALALEELSAHYRALADLRAGEPDGGPGGKPGRKARRTPRR